MSNTALEDKIIEIKKSREMFKEAIIEAQKRQRMLQAKLDETKRNKCQLKKAYSRLDEEIYLLENPQCLEPVIKKSSSKTSSGPTKADIAKAINAMSKEQLIEIIKQSK